ncbi:MAG: hypothetical protein Q8L47_03165 [bacterium]|nr:hypothetical protein [bacterium]
MSYKKKVTICSSGSLVKKAKEWQKKLEEKNYQVIKVPVIIKGNYAKMHSLHYKAIVESDILFVLNLEKNGIINYIGPSVFAEIAFAIGLNLALKKQIKIFCLNLIPQNLPYSKELLLWKKLGWIKKWRKI